MRCQMCKLFMDNSLVRIFLLITLLFFSSCDFTSRKRAVGYFRLGLAQFLKAQETYFPASKILLRHDQNGFSAMSTECTYDLSPLIKKQENGQEVWVSSETESTYDGRGNVLHGPSKSRLPFYKLKLDSAVYGGPADTLYVHVGNEVDPNFRLVN